MRKENLISVLIFLGIIGALTQGCKTRIAEIVNKRPKDSVRCPDILAKDSTSKVQEIKWQDEKYGYYTDPCDQHVYMVVKIGTQVWMAENFVYKPSRGNFWAYENNQINISQDGYLYDWETINKFTPEGWHLPTREEWNILYHYLGNDDKKVFAAIESRGSSGFNALLGGYRDKDNEGSFKLAGTVAYFWSSTNSDAGSKWIFSLNANNSTAYLGYGHLICGFSVRLIRD